MIYQKKENKLVALSSNFNVDSYLDIVYPIGVTYVQYPNCPSPEDLFPTLTWEVQDYEGSFFRAEGGNALTYNGGTQAQATATNGLSGQTSSNTLHNQRIGPVNNDSWIISPSFLYGDASGLQLQTTGNAGYWAYMNMNHDHAVTISSTDTETRPTNQTIRIWKRTA